MKNWKKWIAGIGIGLLVTVLGVGIWQKDNVQALWEAMSYNEEELKTQMETSKEKVQETLQEYEIEGIRDLTVEEEEKLMKGELSVEEALDLILNRENASTMTEEGVLAENAIGNDGSNTINNTINNTGESMGATSSTESQGSTGSSSSGSQGNTGTNSSTSQGSAWGTATEGTKPSTSQIAQKYVEKIYTLQATFLSELGALEARARATFAALPEDKRNLSTAQKLAPSFINQGLALESSCDSQVNALLNEFEAELKKVGASTAIVSNMKESYETQKRLKKAYYLSAIK